MPTESPFSFHSPFFLFRKRKNQLIRVLKFGSHTKHFTSNSIYNHQAHSFLLPFSLLHITNYAKHKHAANKKKKQPQPLQPETMFLQSHATVHTQISSDKPHRHFLTRSSQSQPSITTRHVINPNQGLQP